MIKFASLFYRDYTILRAMNESKACRFEGKNPYPFQWQ